VPLSKGYFVGKPTVVVSLSRIDSDHNENLRIEAYAPDQEIVDDGFNLVVHTWATTSIFSCNVTWIAYEA
jgi:hypothetical protein